MTATYTTGKVLTYYALFGGLSSVIVGKLVLPKS